MPATRQVKMGCPLLAEERHVMSGMQCCNLACVCPSGLVDNERAQNLTFNMHNVFRVINWGNKHNDVFRVQRIQ